MSHLPLGHPDLNGALPETPGQCPICEHNNMRGTLVCEGNAGEEGDYIECTWLVPNIPRIPENQALDREDHQDDEDDRNN
ncbi:hypothetical protein ACHAP5_003080 [Fusarium lateritium]